LNNIIIHSRLQLLSQLRETCYLMMQPDQTTWHPI